MIYQIPDVNVVADLLALSHVFHEPSRAWMVDYLSRGGQVGITHEVLSGSVRLLTLSLPQFGFSSAEVSDTFQNLLDQRSGVVVVRPGYLQIQTFLTFLSRLKLSANDAGGAMLAAAGIVLDSPVVTWDEGFGRFPGLAWRRLGESQVRVNPR